MTPEAQAIIDAATALDAKYAALQQSDAALQASDAALAQKYGVDEQTIQQLRATIAAQIQPTVFTPTVYAGLHKRPYWQRGADVAGIKGSWTQTASPDGAVTFAVTPSGEYNNFYLFTNLESGTRNVLASNYLQITEFEIGDDAVPYCQEIETNFEHTLDNMQFNGGISPLLGQDKMRDPTLGVVTSTVKGSVWRWYDITPGRAGWYEVPEIPFDRAMFGSGKRVRIVSEYFRFDNKMTHAAVTINGTRYAINRTSTAKPQPTWGNHIQHGFQIDTTKIAHPVSVKVWDMECRVL